MKTNRADIRNEKVRIKLDERSKNIQEYKNALRFWQGEQKTMRKKKRKKTK